MNRKIALGIAIAAFLLAHDASAASRMLLGHGPGGWQIYIIPTERGIEYAIARGGQRLKYATDIDAPENRLTSLGALEERLHGLKPRQWVAVDQWDRGASADELAAIKKRIGNACMVRKLGCVYSF